MVASSRDPAAVNIVGHLREVLGTLEPGRSGRWEVLVGDRVAIYMTGDDVLHLNFLDREVRAHVIFIASRHEARARMPSLTVHAPGNWTDEARHGGLGRRLSVAAAPYMYRVLEYMWRRREEYGLSGWACSYEATHHGPYLEASPVLFAEIGSSAEEWRKAEAGRLIADAILYAIETACDDVESWVGLGGPHYAPKLTLRSLERAMPLGHIAPKYVADSIDPGMLAYAASRTQGRVRGVLVDWKGLTGAQRSRLVPGLTELGLEVVRV